MQITTGFIHNTAPHQSNARAPVSPICKWNHRLALQKEAAAGSAIVSVHLVPPLPSEEALSPTKTSAKGMKR